MQLIRKCELLKSDWFGIDDSAATRMATQHLLELGHSRIAYLGGPKALSTGLARLQGYMQAMESWGTPVDPSLIFCEAIDTFHGQQAMTALLSHPHLPSAVVVSTARGTEGALEALRLQGIAVPERLSVVGFNDSPAMAWWGPGLSTLRLPVSEVACASASHLLRSLSQVSAKSPTGWGLVSQYPPTLVVRGSTAPPNAHKHARNRKSV